MEERKNHWETVYKTKEPNQVGWTQEKPTISLELIAKLDLKKDDPIIDIGGGDSKLVDFLLNEGYTNISVLDISAKAIEKAQNRLGEKAKNIEWIVSDILDFSPKKQYKLWHDRASFHFLLNDDEKAKYVSIVKQSQVSDIILGTFSKNGPQKCSGLPICQYNSEELSTIFGDFILKEELTTDHITPFGKAQNFQFVHLKK
jgi:SAM-dependent methyltransferase